MAQRIDNHTKTGGEHLEPKQKVAGGAEISPDIQKTCQELKVRRKHRYVVMKIGDTLIEVEKIGERSETLASLQQTLPYTDCRFILFDLEYQSADRGLQSKLWFISWFPHNAGTYAKMAYTSAKQKLIELMPGVNDTMARSVEELAINLGVSKAEDEDSDMDL